jgi:hypothetical protein
MKPISQHAFRGHIQSLRQIFTRRFEARYGDSFELRANPIHGPGVSLVLQSNSSTNNAEQHEVCATLVTVGQKRILCSFQERWKLIRPKEPEYQFDKAAMAFFLAVPQGNDLVNKQMFRLEWDNWQHQEEPNKAAYPHWQFDRWLTASAADDRNLVELRKAFEPSESDATIFESAAAQQAGNILDRPDLGWFTRLHFPSIAPWATDPIKNLDDPRQQPHRSVPNSVRELEGWIDSSLQYLRNELKTYG